MYRLKKGTITDSKCEKSIIGELKRIKWQVTNELLSTESAQMNKFIHL